MKKETKSWKRRMKGESFKLFERFKIYRDLPPTRRSLNAVKKILESDKSGKNSDKNPIVSLSTLENNSSKWFWKERVELHDAEKILEELHENDEDFKETTEKFKKLFKKMLDFADNLLIRIMNNESEYALTTIMKLFKDLVESMAVLHKEYRLACGRSTTNNNNNLSGEVEVNNNIKPGEENIYEYTPEEMERIQNIGNETEDFTDKL